MMFTGERMTRAQPNTSFFLIIFGTFSVPRGAEKRVNA